LGRPTIARIGNFRCNRFLCATGSTIYKPISVNA
jgi:hypothetical protein